MCLCNIAVENLNIIDTITLINVACSAIKVYVCSEKYSLPMGHFFGGLWGKLPPGKFRPSLCRIQSPNCQHLQFRLQQTICSDGSQISWPKNDTVLIPRFYHSPISRYSDFVLVHSDVNSSKQPGL